MGNRVLGECEPMHRFNVLTGELPVQQDRAGYAWRGRRGVARELGLRLFGASLYDLPDGQWTFPYHYHHGVEEWLYVVAGVVHVLVVVVPPHRRRKPLCREWIRQPEQLEVCA